MYIFSILLNATTLAQATAVVKAACFVFGSKRNSLLVKESLATLQSESKKLPGYKEDTHQDVKDNKDAIVDDNDVFDFEKHYESKSPFKVHFEDIRDGTIEAMKTTDDTGVNNYYAENILNKLFTFLPTIPIWSDLLTGDLRRFSRNYPEQENHCIKSTAISGGDVQKHKNIALR